MVYSIHAYMLDKLMLDKLKAVSRKDVSASRHPTTQEKLEDLQQRVEDLARQQLCLNAIMSVLDGNLMQRLC